MPDTISSLHGNNPPKPKSNANIQNPKFNRKPICKSNTCIPDHEGLKEEFESHLLRCRRSLSSYKTRQTGTKLLLLDWR